MDELVRWLTACLDEDEREIADDYADTGWHARGCESLPDVLYPGRETGSCDCGVPARVLREIEAKRELLGFLADELDRTDSPWWYDDKLEKILNLLAAPYADRPGYLEEWRP